MLLLGHNTRAIYIRLQCSCARVFYRFHPALSLFSQLKFVNILTKSEYTNVLPPKLQPLYFTSPLFPYPNPRSQLPPPHPQRSKMAGFTFKRSTKTTSADAASTHSTISTATTIKASDLLPKTQASSGSKTQPKYVNESDRVYANQAVHNEAIASYFSMR